MTRLAFALIVSWFSMTALIDFVAVPTVFRTVSNLHEAGTLGITIFSKFNALEVIFSLLTLGYSIYFFRKKKGGFAKLLIALSIALTAISFSYAFHITPKIKELSEQRVELEMETDEYVKNEQIHEFYHQLYVKMDGVKLTLLLIALVGVFRQVPKGEKI